MLVDHRSVMGRGFFHYGRSQTGTMGVSGRWIDAEGDPVTSVTAASLRLDVEVMSIKSGALTRALFQTSSPPSHTRGYKETQGGSASCFQAKPMGLEGGLRVQNTNATPACSCF